MPRSESDLVGLAALAEALRVTVESDPATYEMLRTKLLQELDRQHVTVEPDGKLTLPTYEDVWRESPKGLAREDFAALLEAAGYDTGPRGFAQWGAADWESLTPEQREQKMGAIKSLIAEESVHTMPVPPVQVQSQAGPQRLGDMMPTNYGGDDHNVLACPSGKNHGDAYQNTTREGKRFYKCRTPDCHRPGATTTTTWDDSNYSKRVEEFRTGQPAVARGQWRGRS